MNGGAGVQPDEGGLASVVPKTAGLQRRPDGAGFAAMLVHDDVGLHVLAFEARLDEIHLGLDGRQVVLRAALQQETPADGREVRNLRNVEPDILGQHVAETGHDLFRLPALTLEVHNVALHEYRAAVAEAREAVAGERPDHARLVHDTHAVVPRIRDVEIARRVQREPLRVIQLRVHRRTAIPSISFFAVAGDGGHALGTEIQAADALVVQVAEIQGAVGPDHHSIGVVHLRIGESGHARTDECRDRRGYRGQA